MPAGRPLPGRLSESLTMVRGVYLFPTTPQALRSRHVSVDPSIHTPQNQRLCRRVSEDRQAIRCKPSDPVSSQARDGEVQRIGYRPQEGHYRKRNKALQQDAYAGHRLQWCATFSHWTSLRLSAKVQGQQSAKIAREPPDGKEKRGLGPLGSVQDLPASPPEASASKVTPLSGTPSPPNAKTCAQHCGTLPTSPRIPRILPQTPYGYVQPDSQCLGV
ncbi:uncharacterized protein BDZ83DRAFT_323046 [Colletotrichum acutatum]|uniref:Uncharacterized protein n=1 Tax=Glomerella acutata TaxID=27357 RepID=A0AAD8UJA0_GLOAC|nr:uncharacterized protein BDZ83DRAFT_323046 [Colletotrichum acutatum]KAK1724911.1 hypothetical protein BDZ83DRAFT_323046 [Colletotrichum acutatum]